MRTLTFDEMVKYVNSGKLNNVTNARIRCALPYSPFLLRISRTQGPLFARRHGQWRIEHIKGRYIIVEFV